MPAIWFIIWVQNCIIWVMCPIIGIIMPGIPGGIVIPGVPGPGIGDAGCCGCAGA